MTKINVNIIRETKKAKLVEDSEGRQAWVQNRSYSEGLVNQQTFEKGVEFLKARAAVEAERREYNGNLQMVEAAWESEKAIGVDYTAEFVAASSMHQTKRVRVFLPKSQLVHVDGKWQVKGWMLEAKKQEALDKIQPSNSNGWVYVD